MVDGVNGDLDHVVRHVVVEYRTILECVTILNLHVEGKNAKVLDFMPTRRYVILNAVQVSVVIPGLHGFKLYYTHFQ